MDSLIVDPTKHKRIDKQRLPTSIVDQIDDLTHTRTEDDVRHAIEDDFAQKLVNYKTS